MIDIPELHNLHRKKRRRRDSEEINMKYKNSDSELDKIKVYVDNLSSFGIDYAHLLQIKNRNGSN